MAGTPSFPIIANPTGNELVPVETPYGGQQYMTAVQIADFGPSALVDSVNGQTGVVALDAADVSAIPASEKGAAGGVATLDGTGKISASELPPLQHDTAEAASEAAMLALSVTAPAICIRTDFSPPHIFFLTADPASTLGNWQDTGELGAGGANPSVTVGLTAKNGVAATYMRSDAAPAIDQTIAPTWTGAHTFSAVPTVVTGVDGVKEWLAKFTTGSGHSSAPTAIGPTSTYLYVGGREYGAASYRGIGFGYVLDTTQYSPVYVGIQEVDEGGNTQADFIVAVRNGTTNIAPTTIMRVTGAGQISAENPAYVPANPGSLAPKSYVDNRAKSSSYTPNVAGSGNVSSMTVNGTWMVDTVGSHVSVTGRITIHPVAPGDVSVEIFLPVSSNFSGGDTLLSGLAVGTTGSTTAIAASVIANTIDNVAVLSTSYPDTTSRVWQVMFTYTVV